jgi:hypothetical protein
MTSVAAAAARDELAARADDLVAWTGDPLGEVFRSAAICAVLAAGDRAGAARLVERWWAPPVADWTWEFAAAFWALVASDLGTPDPGPLYDAWLPSQGLLTISGTSALAVGSADALLARLARRLGRPADAVAHAQAALAFETRVGVAAWAPRTARLLDELTAAAGGAP